MSRSFYLGLLALSLAPLAHAGQVQQLFVNCTASHDPLAGQQNWFNLYTSDGWRSGIDGTFCAPKSDERGSSWAAGNSTANLLVNSGASVGDGTVSISFRPVSEDTAGVVFRYVDNQNYYIAYVVDNGGQRPVESGGWADVDNGERGLYLYRLSGGVATRLGFVNFDIAKTSTNTILVTMQDTAISVQHNGDASRIINYTAPSYTIGQAGFYAFDNVDARFTSLTVTALDQDNDGLIDDEERVIGTELDDPDTDGDGLNDGDELFNNLSPFDPDTDGGGLLDGYEVDNGLNGNDPADDDSDQDGSLADEDCDDDDPSVFPLQDERCNGFDDNCDGQIDGADAIDPPTFYLDNDDDGHGGTASSLQACAAPDGYSALNDDCDDDEPDAFPSNVEVCDGVDNDCDGKTDDETASDAVDYYLDADSDSYGNPSSSVRACEAPASYVSDATDCNDAQPLAWTGAAEVCDGVDNDCDGTVDQGAEDAATWYADADGDGRGTPSDSQASCTQPLGYAANDQDCDDQDPDAWTGAPEQCDGQDNNCNGDVDEDVVFIDYFADGDGDTFGDPARVENACLRPDGYVDNDADCNDAEPLANDFAAEVCDGVDNDCDGTVDQGAQDPLTLFDDLDGDGYGDPSSASSACEPGADQVTQAGDCNDDEPLAWAGAAEVCDGVDNDCDGSIDASTSGTPAEDATQLYPDLDEDGFGDALGEPVLACELEGYVDDATDCDDGDASISPDATDVPGNGIDEDCSGADATTEPEPEPEDTGDASREPGEALTSETGGAGSGCGCSSSPSPGQALGLALMLAISLVRTRRRAA